MLDAMLDVTTHFIFSENYQEVPVADPVLEGCLDAARSLGRNLIAFDLEHTGGFKGERSITEIGAIIATPDTRLLSFSSFVRPPPGTPFVPYVQNITGISEEMVADAPSWGEVLEHFIVPNEDAIWLGFSSTAADLPIMRDECERLGLPLPMAHHVDLRSHLRLKGRLSDIISQRFTNPDLSGTHRAKKDAWLTLLLFASALRFGETSPDWLQASARSASVDPQQLGS